MISEKKIAENLREEINAEQEHLNDMNIWTLKVSLVALGILICILLLGSVTAAVITTNSSIQDAINNATENDTIFIQTGNYTEQLMINKSITIIGEVNTILFTPENLNYTPTSIYYSRPLIVIYSPDPLNNTIKVDIQNLTLDGNYSSQDYLKAVQFFSADGSLINLNIKNFRDENITALSKKKSSVTINHPYDYFLPQNVLIENCTFENYQQSGILASEIGTNVTIRNNIFIGGGNMSYMKQYGIQVNYGSTGIIENNRISNHYFVPLEYNATGGVGEAAAILTFGNNVYVNDTNFTLNISEVMIRNNLIFNNSFGIYVDGEENYSSGNVVVIGNKFLSNLAAIFLNNASINASLNYWGIANPNFTALILGEGNFSVENLPYYTNFAKTTKNNDPVITPPSSDSSGGGGSSSGGSGGSSFAPVKKNVTTNTTIPIITTPVEPPVENTPENVTDVKVTETESKTLTSYDISAMVILVVAILCVGLIWFFNKPEPSYLPAQISENGV